MPSLSPGIPPPTVPARPISPLNPPGIVEDEERELMPPSFERLYIIAYLRANSVHHQIVFLPKTGNVREVYEAARQWCNERNVRFTFVSAAIEIMEL